MKREQTNFLKLCLADSLIQLLQDSDLTTITINAICQTAQVGRTTFYRHLDKRTGKEDLLLFKISHDWENYQKKHGQNLVQDKNLTLSHYIYENRQLFSLLYRRGLISILMRALEDLLAAGERYDRNLSYLMAFFTYGYFGIIYQWIKYDFDETPEQIKAHIDAMLQEKMTGAD